MNLQVATNRYGSLSIGLHWLMLLLLIAVYACINLREIYPKGSDPREALKMWHFMLGLCVFVLVFVRLALRLTGQTPRIETDKWVQRRLAEVTHFALYVFMIVMPLLGWLNLSASGDAIPFFGLEFPPLTGKDEAFAGQVQEIHETIGTIGYYLIGLHAAAALFHHYVKRDDTLLRMLPRVGNGRGKRA